MSVQCKVFSGEKELANMSLSSCVGFLLFFDVLRVRVESAASNLHRRRTVQSTQGILKT